MVYVAASAEGGWNSVPEGKEGLLELAASMATRGAGERGYDRLRQGDERHRRQRSATRPVT